MNMGKEILKVENLTKIYPGGTLANYKINFSANEGEIHALVGENGAGKSTLMKMLFGMEEITEGKICLYGREVVLHSSKEAIDAGIGMVPQHMMLVPSLTVAENLTLGIEPRKTIFVDQKKCIEETKNIAEKYNLHVEAEKLVRDISVGMKQKLEILKTMYRGAKIIILDEPTAVLAPQETEELFDQLLNLKKAGYTILFISHKLNEVKQICDRLTVLKGGRSVGTYQVSDVTVEQISNLMVGHDISLEYDKKEVAFGDNILLIQNIAYTDKFGAKVLNDVSFSLRAGEILGIAGIEGNGQKEAMDVITGNMKPDQGTVLFKNKDLTKCRIQQIRELGISHISEDRSVDGCALNMSIEDNLIATCLSKFTNKLSILNKKAIDEYCNKCISDYKVKARDKKVIMKSLSGGNIQKAIIAREFTENAEVIILNHPTRGVDVGAEEFIYQKILHMRSQGKSMILVSSDLSKLRALSDRIVVFCEGSIAGYIEDVKETTEEEIGYYMLGLKKDAKEKLLGV